jgi:hypothetical protein
MLPRSKGIAAEPAPQGGAADLDGRLPKTGVKRRSGRSPHASPKATWAFSVNLTGSLNCRLVRHSDTIRGGAHFQHGNI